MWLEDWRVNEANKTVETTVPKLSDRDCDEMVTVGRVSGYIEAVRLAAAAPAMLRALITVWATEQELVGTTFVDVLSALTAVGLDTEEKREEACRQLVAWRGRGGR